MILDQNQVVGNMSMQTKPSSLLLFLLCSMVVSSLLTGCRSTPDYRGLRIDPIECDMGYLSAENAHSFLPFIMGGYTRGPKSLLYSLPFLSWYVNSKQHKGFAFIAPFIVYDIDTIYYASDNRMAGYRNVNFWFLGLFGSTHSLTGVHKDEEVERSFYWFFPLFSGGKDEEGSFFNLFMFIPLA
ncbi:MAG: hypothetical protein ABIK28_07700 [Planctomycetota bacterium]